MEFGNLNTIVSLVVLFVTYLIVKPLQTSIDGLQSTMEKLAIAVDKLREDSTDTQIHVAEVEQNVKSAQKRIDNLCERMHEVEQRCVNCTCRKE